MDQVRLGRTGLQVSVACLGTGGHSRLGQTSGATFEESVDLVRTALDEGVSFVDTASTYGTDEMVGAAVRGRRDEVVITSKIHLVREQSTFYDNDFVDEAELRGRVEGTLSRLGTDYVDVLYLHGVVADQYEHAVAVGLPLLERLREEGKIRFTGISERFSIEPRHDMLDLALRDAWFDVLMVGLNLVNHTARRSVLPGAQEKDLGVQAIYAVRGRLASAERARGLVAEAIAAGEVDPDAVDREDPLGFVLGEGGARTLVDACYRYVRHTAGVHAVVTGTGSVEHLRQNLASIDGPPLPAPTLARLKRSFGRVESVTAE